MITVLASGQVEFRFFRRDVSKVCIVGTFNRWDADADLMEDLGGGWWRAVLALEDGLHQFRYRADGEWFTDFAALGGAFKVGNEQRFDAGAVRESRLDSIISIKGASGRFFRCMVWGLRSTVVIIKPWRHLMQTQEIPDNQWGPFFDELSKRHQGEHVTVELLGRDIGVQMAAEDQSLMGISVDARPGHARST